MTNNRWTAEQAHDWNNRTGWLVGCNFSPSTAGNQLEMWQPQTFDIATISKELGWAADIGMNTIRLYLHDLLFTESPENFLDQIDVVLSIAQSRGIGVVPVLFDGVWNPKPRLGVQREPTPRLHNSMWVQSPGSEIFYDRSRWPGLREYVQVVITRFKNDPRVLAWDLFNEPDQVDTVTLTLGSREEKIKVATELVSQVFDWAQEISPSQPLTVGIWEYNEHWQPAENSLNALILDRSDIISFHCYEPREKLTAVIESLKTYGRPLLCTEWLARSAGSTVDLLEVFSQHGVGAINWGLVDGRTQTRFPWRSWTEPVTDEEPWFHELLHRDGSPYDSKEADIFRHLTSLHM
jgi:endo-1,4-beta-mannosidase